MDWLIEWDFDEIGVLFWVIEIFIMLSEFDENGVVILIEDLMLVFENMYCFVVYFLIVEELFEEE